MIKQKPKILIVEDEYYLAEIIKARLEFEGYQAAIAEHGQAALDHLKKEPADIVLMDIMMPVMDGLEAAKKIKADTKLQKIPVIFLTARAQHEDHLKAHQAGGDDYISKPFEMEDLLAKIKKWIPV